MDEMRCTDGWWVVGILGIERGKRKGYSTKEGRVGSDYFIIKWHESIHWRGLRMIEILLLSLDN